MSGSGMDEVGRNVGMWLAARTSGIPLRMIGAKRDLLVASRMPLYNKE